MPLYIKLCILLAIIAVLILPFSKMIDDKVKADGKLRRIIRIVGIGVLLIVLIVITAYIYQGLSVRKCYQEKEVNNFQFI